MTALAGPLARRPLQRRVTLLTVVLVSLAIVLSNLAGYVALRLTLTQASRSVTTSVASELAGRAAVAIGRTGGLTLDLRQAGGTVVEALCADGRVLRIPGEREELLLRPDDRGAAGDGARPVTRTGVGRSGEPYTVVAVPAGSTGCALVVARPRSTLESVLRVEQLISVTVVLSSLVAASLASFFVARTALDPVRRLSAAVQHVTQTRDFQPVSISYAYGDLAVLTASFNQLLPGAHGDPGTSGPARRRRQLARDDAAATFRPVDLREPVRAAVERVQRRAGGRVLDLRLDEFHVVGDPSGLERAVTNLLDNAVKWSPPGSTIRVRLHGNRLVVADSGPGIAEADLPYVFDRFFRGASARKTHGTGLGLSIVAKAVEEHGGTVEAGRSADGGAEFTVRLPGVTHVEAMPAILVPGERASADALG